MNQSEALKGLLFNMRQHPAFAELVMAIEQPKLPHYRPSKDKSLEELGAETAYQSGRRDMHEAWQTFLRGN